MLWPIAALFALLAMGASRRTASSGPSSVPHGSVYLPGEGTIVTPDGRRVEVPNADGPPDGPVPPDRALVPTTPPPAIPNARTSTTTAPPPDVEVPVGPRQPVKQPPGTTGNLPNITRPLGRAGFNPEVAHKLAPQVVASLRRGPQRYSKALLVAFQKAADLDPADGVYGPRTAGALEYFAAVNGKPAKVPQPWTTDKRVIPYAI